MPALTLIPGGLIGKPARLRDAQREIAKKAPQHPVLRWTPRWAPDQRGQHRLARGATDRTACGLAGSLDVAMVSDPPCRTCFPKAR